MTKMILAESDPTFSQRLVTAAGEAASEVAATSSLQDAALMLRAESPAVLVVGPSFVNVEALATISELTELPGRACVVVAAEVDTELLRAGIRAGVLDVVGISEPIADLTDSLCRAAQSVRRSAEAQSPGSAEEGPQLGKLITVFSTKGGVGKTVLATNLAVALTDTGKRVAIIDLDLQFGDVGIMLGLKPEHTLYDAIQVFDRLDRDLLEGFMETHSSGVRALLAPTRPEDAENISAGRVGQIIDLVRANFDYVVIDTSPSFSETVLSALDRSDELYVLTMMDVASIKNTRISLQKLRQLGYDNGRVRLVLNRSDSKVLLQPSEVEQAMGGKVSAHIPSDRIVPRSVNKGVPVVIDAPKSDVARSMRALAKGASQSVVKEVDGVA